MEDLSSSKSIHFYLELQYTHLRITDSTHISLLSASFPTLFLFLRQLNYAFPAEAALRIDKCEEEEGGGKIEENFAFSGVVPKSSS